MAETIPYRPSNGTEGELFMSQWCARCQRDRGSREADGDGCDIIAMTMAFNIRDPEYPKEWRQDGLSGPRCTAFLAEGAEEPQDPAAAIGDMFAAEPSNDNRKPKWEGDEVAGDKA